MRLLDILPQYEINKFESPAELSNEERAKIFKIDSRIQQKITNIKNKINKVGFLLQYGYFIQHNKFFNPAKFNKRDIVYASHKLRINAVKDIVANYSDRTRQQQRKDILDVVGYTSYAESVEAIREIISKMVEKQAHPRKIFAKTLEVLVNRKIEIPSYHFLVEQITLEFNRFEKNAISKIKTNITESQKESLDTLLHTIKGDYQRTLVTRLKHVNQSMRPAKIKHGLRNFLIIKKLFFENKSIIDTLGLSNEAIKYYAQWLIKAQSYQTISITEENKRYLHLLAFLSYYYKIWQDMLVDILLKSVQQQLNKMEKINTDQVKEDLPGKNKLTHTVLSGLQTATLKVEAVKTVLYSREIDNDRKIKMLYDIIPETTEKQAEESIFAAKTLGKQITQENKNIPKMNILSQLSRKLQNRVADIVKCLIFSQTTQDEELVEAINYYQSHAVITVKAPRSFLSNIEQELVYNTGKFNVALYKAILFCKIANAIKCGNISLDISNRYLSLDSYLVELKDWEENKEKYLKEYDLEKFKNIENLLHNLSEDLDPYYRQVNNTIRHGKNSYVKIAKEGKPSVYTPPISKPDYDSIIEIIGKDKYIQILQIMFEINNATKFTTHFKHHKNKQSKENPKDIIFFASIFAIASGIGLHKLANTSVGINYNTLVNCVTWYFSLENLDMLNQELTKHMKKLSLPEKFKKDRESLHTSNDAQKTCVSAESLNSDYSYKYHGHSKGINICRFIDERGILFYSNTFGSAERDAAYVIDGLLNDNKEIYSDIHSTDTLGYTEMVFAISHLLNVKFAPRIKDLASQNLISFGKIKKELESIDACFVPSYYVKTEKIIDNWDLILRLMVTIKKGEYKPSVILKRLGSYPKQHALQAALKEFGRIIKSKFILEYVDDVDLRQSIEKQLNKGELANKFASAVSFASDDIPYSHTDDHEVFAMCQTIIQNIIILWNYIELTKIIMRSDGENRNILIENITSSSILTWQHVNMHGTYDFTKFQSNNDNEFKYEEIKKYKIA